MRHTNHLTFSQMYYVSIFLPNHLSIHTSDALKRIIVIVITIIIIIVVNISNSSSSIWIVTWYDIESRKKKNNIKMKKSERESHNINVNSETNKMITIFILIYWIHPNKHIIFQTNKSFSSITSVFFVFSFIAHENAKWAFASWNRIT